MAGYFGRVSAKLDLDITDFEKGLARSAQSVEKIGGKLANKFGAKAIATSLATALGLGITKIGESAARMWTGMTEQAEKAFEKLTELSAKNADDTIENMRSLISEEKKYQLLLLDRQKLQRNPTNPEKEEPGFFEKYFNAEGVFNPISRMLGKRLRENREARNAQAGVVAKEEDKAKEIKLSNEMGAIDKKRADAKKAADKAEHDAMITRLKDEEKIVKMEDEWFETRDRMKKEIKGSIPYEELRKSLVEQGLKIDEERERLEEKKQRELEKQTRELDKQKDLSDDIVNSFDKQLKAQKSLTTQLEDRSSSTLGELAGSRTSPDRVKAREIQRLEARAKWRRSHGFGPGADADTNRALKLRGQLGALVSSDRDPMEAARDKILEASKNFLEAIDKKLAATKLAGDGSGSAPKKK